MSSLFTESGYEDLYDAAFDVWGIAKSHIHEAWMFNADPANLTPQIPRVMRDAAEFVRADGSHLGDRQDDLVERLEAPYSPRIQRTVRDVLSQDVRGRDKVNRLLALADHLGLVKQPSPEPLPEITSDDIHLVCWTAIVTDA
ncbi:hypothetical protein [Streptomyces griseoluteus]|uniref:hypothetical protein n=1 Tax=Streptomyces griseoluteus TaxID=29306 RepID=UPI003803B5D1